MLQRQIESAVRDRLDGVDQGCFAAIGRELWVAAKFSTGEHRFDAFDVQLFARCGEVKDRPGFVEHQAWMCANDGFGQLREPVLERAGLAQAERRRERGLYQICRKLALDFEKCDRIALCTRSLRCQQRAERLLDLVVCVQPVDGAAVHCLHVGCIALLLQPVLQNSAQQRMHVEVRSGIRGFAELGDQPAERVGAFEKQGTFGACGLCHGGAQIGEQQRKKRHIHQKRLQLRRHAAENFAVKERRQIVVRRMQECAAAAKLAGGGQCLSEQLQAGGPAGCVHFNLLDELWVCGSQSAVLYECSEFAMVEAQIVAGEAEDVAIRQQPADVERSRCAGEDHRMQIGRAAIEQRLHEGKGGRVLNDVQIIEHDDDAAWILCDGLQDAAHGLGRFCICGRALEGTADDGFEGHHEMCGKSGC